MEMGLFFRGILIGFSIAAPVGPIGVLCIRRTLVHGRLSGLISGLGAATADAFYGVIAALGLTIISNFLIDQKNWLGLVGGLFLCYLGAKIFLAPAQAVKISQLPSTKDDPLEGEEQRYKYLAVDYASTFLLTLTNPMTILSFAAIYAGLGLAAVSGSALSGLWLVIGVFLGSSAWWLMLSMMTNIFREKFLSESGLQWVNKISGIVLAAFGVGALLVVYGRF